MKKRIILLLLAAATALTAAAKPRLIVQIVVGSMRAGDLERYAANFGDGGFRRLTGGGTVYADARYDCMQTTTPVSLATLATGALPSMHGIIGLTWKDYTSNETVFLTEGKRGPGAYRFIAPTLAETLRAQCPESRTVTVAAEAESAVILAGKGGNAFWLDTERCDWVTSPYYAEELPDWVRRSNRERYNLSYLSDEWRTLLDRNLYRNTRHWDITLAARSRKEKDDAGKGRLRPADDLERLRCTPAGNSALLGFAKQAIAQYRLGADEVPDLLTVCLDPARRIMETYGPESVEVEDLAKLTIANFGDPKKRPPTGTYPVGGHSVRLVYFFGEQITEQETRTAETNNCEHGYSSVLSVSLALRSRLGLGANSNPTGP